MEDLDNRNLDERLRSIILHKYKSYAHSRCPDDQKKYAHVPKFLKIFDKKDTPHLKTQFELACCNFFVLLDHAFVGDRF